jgi:hypothetical protein
VAIQVTAEDSFILQFDRDASSAKVEEGAKITAVTDKGVEEAFKVVASASLKSFLSPN